MIKYQFHKECIVYLDALKKNEDGKYDIYIDFRLPKDLILYTSFSSENKTFSKDKTYIYIKSLKTSKRLIPGCYYKLNLILLKEFSFVEDEDSLFIGRSYDLHQMQHPIDDSQELLQTHELLDPKELLITTNNNSDDAKTLNISTWNRNFSVLIRDVGQANWNELLEDNVIKVVYDLGAELHAKRHEVERIFKSRYKKLRQDKPILVLSHWDIDHIHCLSYTNIKTIKECFSLCICVNFMKSLTSHKVYKSIVTALGQNKVFCLVPPPRTNGIKMHLWKDLKHLAFYRGEKSRNINFSGICMFYKGDSGSVIFTGDIKLIQAKNVFESEKVRGTSVDNHILIAPHHGGDYSPKARLYSSPIKDALISVGKKNIYGHPEKQMLSYLQSISSNNIHRTDIDGDIILSI